MKSDMTLSGTEEAIAGEEAVMFDEDVSDQGQPQTDIPRGRQNENGHMDSTITAPILDNAFVASSNNALGLQVSHTVSSVVPEQLVMGGRPFTASLTPILEESSENEDRGPKIISREHHNAFYTNEYGNAPLHRIPPRSSSFVGETSRNTGMSFRASPDHAAPFTIPAITVQPPTPEPDLSHHEVEETDSNTMSSSARLLYSEALHPGSQRRPMQRFEDFVVQDAEVHSPQPTYALLIDGAGPVTFDFHFEDAAAPRFGIFGRMWRGLADFFLQLWYRYLA